MTFEDDFFLLINVEKFTNTREARYSFIYRKAIGPETLGQRSRWLLLTSPPSGAYLRVSPAPLSFSLSSSTILNNLRNQDSS